jgi:uncharacterized membrane protein YkvA (DUF1232 family)
MSLKEKAEKIRTDLMTLYFAAQHPNTPVFSKILIFLIVAYAVSPIDLIPDFIPVLGYLDELILLPMAFILVLKTLPPHVTAECRQKASLHFLKKGKLHRIAGAFIILGIWTLALLLLVSLCI